MFWKAVTRSHELEECASLWCSGFYHEISA